MQYVEDVFYNTKFQHQDTRLAAKYARLKAELANDIANFLEEEKRRKLLLPATSTDRALPDDATAEVAQHEQ